MSDIRKRAISGLKQGDVFVVSRTFTKEDSQVFADISRDYNPVHFDERFAASKQFTGPICHGLLVGSLLTEAGGQMGWLASGMDFRFRKPVYFDDTIECVLTITQLDERLRASAEVVFKNQHGDVVIEATVRGIVPGPPEREVMEKMLREGDPTNGRR